MTNGQLDKNRFITPEVRYINATRENMLLPTLEGLQRLTYEELIDLLQYYGITASRAALMTRAQLYITRMTELRPNSDAWRDEVNRLLDSDVRNGMLGRNRRVVQSWSALASIDGNIDKTMIWITEIDESVCVNCEANAGLEKTWAQWQIDGPPGAAVCLGQDRCRCDLVVVE
jgi:hypothetical protein